MDSKTCFYQSKCLILATAIICIQILWNLNPSSFQFRSSANTKSSSSLRRSILNSANITDSSSSSPPNLLFFYHIPKTGGTSIKSALDSTVIKKCEIESYGSSQITLDKLEKYLLQSSNDNESCSFIEMEFKRSNGQNVKINSFNDYIYQFTMLRDPFSHFISAVTHDLTKKHQIYSNVNVTEVIDIKLNKTKREHIGYKLFDGNFQINRLMNTLDLGQNDIDKLVINNEVNSDKMNQIIAYLTNNFKFIGITEYHRQSLCFLFYDLYIANFSKKMKKYKNMNQIADYCKCQKQNAKVENSLMQRSDSLLRTSFISPLQIKQINAINRVDTIIYNHFFNQLMIKINHLENILNVSILC